MEDFHEKYVNLLFYEAKKHLPVQEDAEDAVQDTWEYVYENIRLFRMICFPRLRSFRVI